MEHGKQPVTLSCNLHTAGINAARRPRLPSDLDISCCSRAWLIITVAVFGNHYVEDAQFFREKSKERLFNVKLPSDLESDKLELNLWVMLYEKVWNAKNFSTCIRERDVMAHRDCSSAILCTQSTEAHIYLPHPTDFHREECCHSFVLKIFGTLHFSFNYFLWSTTGTFYRFCITKYTYQPKHFRFAIHLFSVSPKTDNNRPEKKRKYATRDFVILRENKVHILFYSF